MNVLLDGFFRINEALSLRKQDIDFDQCLVTVRAEESKSRWSRTIPLQKRTISLLEELLKENDEFDLDYIFLANYGERLTDTQFRHRLREHAVNAGIKRRVHPHLFRHTAATMALEAGMDLRNRDFPLKFFNFTLKTLLERIVPQFSGSFYTLSYWTLTTKVYNYIENILSPLDFALVVGMGFFLLLLKGCEWLSGVLEKFCIKFKFTRFCSEKISTRVANSSYPSIKIKPPRTGILPSR